MSTQQAISGNAYKNNGATILYGGGTVDENVTSRPGLTIAGFQRRAKDTRPKIVANITQKARSGLSNFAVLKEDKYIIPNVTTELAGTTVSRMNTAAGALRRPINFLESRKTLLQVTAGWNYVTGAFLTTPSTQDDDFGQDHAARPTRAVPGEFVILESFVSPTTNQKDYEAKNG